MTPVASRSTDELNERTRRRLSGKCQCVWSYIQQVAGTLSRSVVAAFILHSSVCGSTDQAFLAQLISISVFISGLCTVLQTAVGVRYCPSVQVHIIQMMHGCKWNIQICCPEVDMSSRGRSPSDDISTEGQHI